MDTRFTTVLDTLRRAQRFLDANAPAVGPINQSGARKELDAVIGELTTHLNAQESARRQAMGETSKQRALRTALLKQMRPIARIAASTLRQIPEFSSLTAAFGLLRPQRLQRIAPGRAPRRHGGRRQRHSGEHYARGDE